LIIFVSSVIFLLGRLFSAKPMHDKNSRSAYACGEKVNFNKLKISVSYYKYLIYFVILDSAVLSVAFGALAIHVTNVLFLIIYLFIVFISILLLLEGGDN